MPIQRFGSMLISKGQFNAYMELLQASPPRRELGAVMCRLVSVDWQGAAVRLRLQPAARPAAGAMGAHRRRRCSRGPRRLHLRDLLAGDLAGASIRVADHCFGCTAGSGSSCGGALKA